MGVASLALGIVSVVLALIIGLFPPCFFWVFVPALIGLVFGIVEIAVQRRKEGRKGLAIAGLILNGLAIAGLLVFYFFLFRGLSEGLDGDWQWNIQTGGGPPATAVDTDSAAGAAAPMPAARQPVPVGPGGAMQPMQPVAPSGPPDGGAATAP